jgi:thioredoxin-related protein
VCTGRILAALSALTVAWILAWPPARAGTPAPDLPTAIDLAADARQMRRQRLPMLMLYSQPGCHWCERVRREHLRPMLEDPGTRERILLRQIDIDSTRPLQDFDGRRTTQRAFAARANVRFTPTLIVHGPDGALLAEPIVGVSLPDFYGAYMDGAIERGLAAMRTTRTQ